MAEYPLFPMIILKIILRFLRAAVRSHTVLLVVMAMAEMSPVRIVKREVMYG